MNLDMAVTLVIVAAALFFVIRSFAAKKKSGSCGCTGCSCSSKNELKTQCGCSNHHS